MIAIGVSDFRANIQKYLGFLKKGEEIVLTAHGKEIARVVPPLDTTAMAQKELERLSVAAVTDDVIAPIDVGWKAS